MLEPALEQVFSALSLSVSARFIDSVAYFIEDSVKILLLLAAMIFVIGVLRTYLPREKIAKLLGRTNKFVAHTIAALFGAVTPFCSCSSIPIFVGFLESGAPLGVALSFLITSPLVNEYLVVLMLVAFGLKVTILYIVSGVFIGVIAGMILSRQGLERHLVKDFVNKKTTRERYARFCDRFAFGYSEAVSILKKLWLWVLAGVAVGAVIHNYVAETFVQHALSATGIFSVPLAVLIGVPMYASSAALVPVVGELVAKGVPLGTAIAFMMAAAGLSLPEVIILRRTMKLRLILLFFGVVALAILATGILFNVLV